jgi:integrase
VDERRSYHAPRSSKAWYKGENMAIVKKKNRKFLYTRFTECRVRVDESTRTNSRAEAQEYEDKRRNEIRRVVMLGKKPSKTWVDAEIRWLDEMKHKRSIYYDIVHFEWLQSHLSNYCLSEITKDLIEKIAIEKEKTGVKPSTVNRVLALIRAVLNRAAKQWEWIDKVPYIQMRREKNKRIRWLTREESNRLLIELPDHLRSMAKFTLATGLRASNVFYLEWGEIDMNRKYAIIPSNKMKTGKTLGVPLNQDAINVIKSQIGKHDKYVFIYRGKPVTQCSTRAWRLALKRAEIKDFRWHDLRHTWASWHVQSGTSLQELAELGGWASMDMVLRYAHLSGKHLESAANRISGANSETLKLRLVEGGGK